MYINGLYNRHQYLTRNPTDKILKCHILLKKKYVRLRGTSTSYVESRDLTRPVFDIMYFFYHNTIDKISVSIKSGIKPTRATGYSAP